VARSETLGVAPDIMEARITLDDDALVPNKTRSKAAIDPA
jgi:hypothetical protein